jgi:CheY-like chemotaxis protein
VEPRRALVVDDDASVREFVRGALEGAGYRVEECAAGAGCVEKARAFRPDVVLLDLVLPDANGGELLAPLRSSCAAPPAVVAFTGYFRTLDEVREENPGFDGYVLKPVREKRLLRDVEDVLGRRPTPGS